MNNSFSRYIKQVLFFSTLLISSVALFSYIVDPFSVYGRTYVVNETKVNSPGFSAQLKMGRAIAIKQRSPDAIIMGSSRSTTGFSFESAQKYMQGNNLYNASFPGILIYEIFRYLQHTVAVSPVKQVYIGLDFYQFHGGIEVESSFKESRLAVDVNNVPSESAIDDFVSTLLSGDSFFYSFKVFTGLCNWNDVYLPNGFKYLDHGSGDLNRFLGSEKTYVDKTYTFPAYTFLVNSEGVSTFDYLRKIIELAHKKNIDLRFFISPSHARQWEVIEQLGLWEKWEYWKRNILAITNEQSRIFDTTPFPIYDFSGYSQYSTEEVPRNNSFQMHWYSDSSHYKQTLGDIVLMHMSKNSNENGFGRILNLSNIDRHLQSIREDRLSYTKNHEQDVKDIQKLISKN